MKSKKIIRLGIFGLGRGSSYVEDALLNDGELVAFCDRDVNRMKKAAEKLPVKPAFYTDFDAFLEHDMDAVFLANNFNEHAPYAIRCLEKGLHVLTECTSNGTMAEGVALVRAAEKSDSIFMLAENYPFMQFNQEMRSVYRGGTLFAEGEYNHPGNPSNTSSTTYLKPYPKHWRNYLPRTYYVTHSLAPLMYITGSRPVRVTAMPVYAPTEATVRSGSMVGDRAAIITTLNDDNSVYRVTGHASFGAGENSYRVCATKGQIENVRGGDGKVMLRYNPWETPENVPSESCYKPSWPEGSQELVQKSGHGGSDFFVMKEFFDCIREGRQPEFDVYFATTCASVGILGHRSLMEKGVPYDIPDFRKEEDRLKYENDHETPFYGADGSEPTIPCCSNPDYRPTPEQYQKYLELYEV